MMSIIERLFTKSSSRKTTPVRKRQLRLETLESRELLSVNPALVQEVQAAYADLNLAGDYNVIEITANELSDANLRAAIAEAGTTTANDLIVLRTTATQNKITLSGTELAIDFVASSKGSVTIVGLGTNSLTLDANQQSRIFNISGGGAEVGLAGLTITNGYTNDSGGGIYNRSATLTVTNSTITGNSAAYVGGGVYSVVYNGSTTLTVTNSTITGNKADSDGGGIYNNNPLTVTNSTIMGNSADEDGGGIYNGYAGTLTVTNSMIAENSANYGSGIYNGGTLAITNSTITGNSAGESAGEIGGGIYNLNVLTLTNSTITGNSAKRGGGIYNGGTLTITNSTITGNSADYGGGIYNAYTTKTVTVTLYNTIVAKNSTDFRRDYGTIQGFNNLTSFTDWTGTSGDNLFYDSWSPLFVDENNGDYRLTADSQAVDKGNNSYVPSSITTDLAGNARIQGGTVDIGAYEYGSTSVVAPAAPTVTTSLENGKPKLSWNAVTGAVTYRVYRLNAAGTGWDNISGNTYTGLTFTDTTAEAGKTYTYAVKAFLSGGAIGSEFSAFQKVTATSSVPAAPTVTTSLENGKPKLTWNAVTGAVTYRVYRLNADGKGWTNISGNTFNGTTFTDTTVPAGVHTYAVRAFAADGATGSEFVSAKYATVAVTPDAPTVTKTLDNGKPKLTWNAVTGAVAYRVYRLNADGLGWTNVSGNNLKATTFTDTGLSAAGVYTYAVRAFLNDGVTGSAFVSAKYATIGVTPTAPTVTTSLENGKPKLTWNPVTGAVTYRVYRLNDAGNGWINVSGNALKLTTFTDTTAQTGKTYTYSVQAFLNDGVTNSGFVNTKYVTVTTV